jgi:hypothetical protein
MVENVMAEKLPKGSQPGSLQNVLPSGVSGQYGLHRERSR